MANNRYEDKKGRYEFSPVTLETVDGAVFDYFDKKLAPTVAGTDKNDLRTKVQIYFSGHERWKIVRENGFRDKNGTLVLPIVSLKRTDINRERGFGGMAQEDKTITVSKVVHPKSSNIRNLTRTKSLLGMPEKDKGPVIETLTIPFPDFCNINYEVTLWSQYQADMNEVLEKIFYKFEHLDSFVIPVDYDGNRPSEPLGMYFMGFRQGDIVKESNDDDYTDQERIIRYSYTIRVPAYLMLDPKDEALSYGRDENGKKILYKQQNVIDVKLKETVLSAEEFYKLYGDI